jgi:integrase
MDEVIADKEVNTSPSNAELYRVALEKAKACWNDIPLQHITRDLIVNLIRDMIREGLKNTTINKNIRHLKGALSLALDWGYIKKPVKFPKPLEEGEKIRYLKTKEIQDLFDVIDDREFADFCELSAYTGLRSGEILRLTFQDVDNPEGFLRIDSKQKNRSESRIPINKHARSIIGRCISRRKGESTLFRFKTVSWVSQKFRIYADKAGLNNCRFHDLRHTFGSHLAIKGKDLLTIKELMRHKSIASTMIYAKLSPEYLKDASEDLDYGPMPVGKKKD